MASREGSLEDGYEMSHRFGSSVCLHHAQGLDSESTLFVPRNDPVKVVRVRLTNRSGRPRRITLSSYSRLVLGGLPSESASFIVTEHDPLLPALLAHNRFSRDYAQAVAFAAVVVPDRETVIRYTCDRTTFLGECGTGVAGSWTDMQAPDSIPASRFRLSTSWGRRRRSNASFFSGKGAIGKKPPR